MRIGMFLTAMWPGLVAAQEVLVMGDSTLAWNRQGVARGLEAALGVSAEGRAVPGANMSAEGLGQRILGGQVPGQYRDGPWDWVVVNGGANDLLSECDAGGCGPVVDGLVSADGARGEIPTMIAQLRATGARVVWVDYYLSPRGLADLSPKNPDFEALQERTRAMAARDPGVLWVDMGDVLDPRDPDDFARDRLHPSAVGSGKVAVLVAEAMRGAD
ncbi:MAG: SGNH/GDSL hydrolase family protein [Shimia sp.]